MSFSYTRTQLKSDMNGLIQGRIGVLVNANDTVNRSVREVFSGIDLRSAKRKSQLVPGLFRGIYDYSCPTDLKALKIIDIEGQVKRADGEYELVPPEEFDRRKGDSTGLIAFDDYNGLRIVKIGSQATSTNHQISSLDSLTESGGSVWTALGDAENITRDNDNYISGSASIKYDISSAGGTTAGIQNTGIAQFDLDDDFLGGSSSAFIRSYLSSAADITNFILRLGSSSLNYHSKTVTSDSSGNEFATGWNLLRFDLSNLTDTGTPDDDAIDYAAIYMTKDAGKVSETGYRFDDLVIKKGIISNLKYYTKYGWQSSAGAYKENSTDDLDVLVADTDEYNIIIAKCVESAIDEIEGRSSAKGSQGKYEELKNIYIKDNPSEAKILMNQYYAY